LFIANIKHTMSFLQLSTISISNKIIQELNILSTHN
jgi:hypothetical protein